METISYILSIAGLIAMIISSLIKGKNMKMILFFVFLGNVLVATSYLFTQNLNGAVSCFIGGAQALINYFFDSKNKKLPVWLITLYAVAFLGANLAVFTEVVDVIAIIASLTFIMCVGQKNGARYRIWTIINMCLWCLYDVLKGAYGPLTTHVTLLVFTVAGMLIHDRKKSCVSIED